VYSPQISSLELNTYPQFLRQVRADLRLGPEEERAIAQVDPMIWAQWGISTLAGDESITRPYRSSVKSLLPERALPLFAKEIEISGAPALDYRGGALTRRIEAMHASKNPSMQQRLEKFSKTMAAFTFAVGTAMGLTSNLWIKFVPQIPQTTITGDRAGKLAVFFPGDSNFSLPVEGKATSVMTFGPGLSGGMFARSLIGHTDKVFFVSGGKGAHFISSWIDMHVESLSAHLYRLRRTGRLHKNLPPGVRAENARVPEAVYRNEGIAAAIGSLPVKKNIDVMVMSSVHTAGIQECLAGVEGASAHLRPGGLLVVKAPTESIGNEAGMDLLVAHASTLFGAPVASGDCGVLHQNIDPSLPLERSASFAIYQR
jgi:hypothetical protein